MTDPYALQRRILEFTREREKLTAQLESPLCESSGLRIPTMRKIAEVNADIARLQAEHLAR